MDWMHLDTTRRAQKQKPSEELNSIPPFGGAPPSVENRDYGGSINRQSLLPTYSGVSTSLDVGAAAFTRKTPPGPMLATQHEVQYTQQRSASRIGKGTTSLLVGWLLQHLDHPYPTEEEKEYFVAQTGLSSYQACAFLEHDSDSG
jgi:hypothetical protein